jgi:hypothetical protein
MKDYPIDDILFSQKNSSNFLHNYIINKTDILIKEF